MANITITVQSLLNTAVHDSYTIDDGQTVAQLKTQINTAKSFDSTWYDLVLNGILSESATLASLGIVNGSQLSSHNKIARLATRELRQKAKLNLASLDRAATNSGASARSTYDITELPTQYSNNTVVDNANTGGLVQGRPWISGPAYTAGIYRSQYTGWPNQITAYPTWFDGKTPASSAVATDFELTLTAAQTNLAYQWIGYFKPDYTGTWTFSTGGQNIDDTVTVWVGSAALSGYVVNNSLFSASVTAGSGTVSVTAGTYYPIRVQYANYTGPGLSTVYYAHTGQAATKNWTGKLFYNPATNGF